MGVRLVQRRGRWERRLEGRRREWRRGREVAGGAARPASVSWGVVA